MNTGNNIDSSALPLDAAAAPIDSLSPAIEPPSSIIYHPPSSAALRRLRRALLFPVKLFWGMIFCQGLLGSIFVVGWSYRLAQRFALKYWWSHSSRAQPNTTFADFLAGSERTRDHRHWPNWFLQQDFAEALRRQPGVSAGRYVFSVVRAFTHGLWLNFWMGLRAIANTWALTLPACIFWWFGWYDGWNNSFNKGYEQAAVGPLVSLLGILLFIAAMFYVPLAQARQAVTGDWRAFFEFRLVWNLARLRWVSCVGLALLYSLLALPLNILKTSPMFWMQKHPELVYVSDALLLKMLNDYFFWCALLMLPAYVLLRVLAARVYASAIMASVQSGNIQPAALAVYERETLDRLGLLETRPSRERHVFVRFLAWTGTRVGRVLGGAALFFTWFGFVAQIYIAEFFNYHGGLGWLNQPLVQLPWFHYLPSRLKTPLGEVFFVLLAWFVALLIWSVLSTIARSTSRQASTPPPTNSLNQRSV